MPVAVYSRSRSTPVPDPERARNISRSFQYTLRTGWSYEGCPTWKAALRCRRRRRVGRRSAQTRTRRGRVDPVRPGRRSPRRRRRSPLKRGRDGRPGSGRWWMLFRDRSTTSVELRATGVGLRACRAGMRLVTFSRSAGVGQRHSRSMQICEAHHRKTPNTWFPALRCRFRIRSRNRFRKPCPYLPFRKHRCRMPLPERVARQAQ